MPDIDYADETQYAGDARDETPPPPLFTDDELPPEGPPDLNVIIGAPPISEFLHPKRTATQREYEQRVASVLRAGLIGALNTGQITDAAAIIRFGPQFARATGHLADANETARKGIHAVTSPSDPLLSFVMSALPLVSQLFRNHQDQFAAIPEMRQSRKVKRAQAKAAAANGEVKPEARFGVKIPGTRFRIPLRVSMNARSLGKIFSGLKAQTQEPATLANTVFSDEKTLLALQKLGVTIYTNGEQP